MADPNQPTNLNQAITPVGTCTSMCPEFERVERIVQKMVDKSEKVCSCVFPIMTWVMLKLSAVPPPFHRLLTKYGDENAQALPEISRWV